MKNKTFIFFVGLLVMIVTGMGACKKTDNDTTGPTRGIYSAGTAMIKGTFSFDFDTGTGGTTPVPTGNVADVWWERMTTTTSQLVPQNGAQLAVLGVTDYDNVTWDQVKDTTLSSGPILYTNLTVGTVVVYRTDAGRYGKFRINLFSGNQDLTIKWLTWE